jgi:HK97 gp10 family phage protein
MGLLMPGLDKLKARLDAIPKAVRKAVAPALIKSAEEIAGAQRQLAARDTGALMDSIAVTGPGEQTPPYSQPGGSRTVGENQVAITAGNSKVRYAHLVEYGTAKAYAQPYFWPAFRLYRVRARRRINTAIGKAVREAK